MKKILSVIMVLVIISLACSLGPIALPSGGGDNGGGGAPSGGAPSGGAPSGGVPSGGTVLFQDDFSDPNSGWDRVDADYKMTDYQNGGYRMWTSRTMFDIWATPYQSFTGDIVIDVDATKIGGPDDNDFGVICRYTEANSTFSFYYFLISSDGFAVIGRVLDGDQQYISAEAMMPADGINLGAATNHIRAECIGQNLKIYANGTLVAEATDSYLTSGDVGLMAGTFGEPGVDILFDNFVVTRP